MRFGGATAELQIVSFQQTVKRHAGFYIRKNVR